MLKSEELAKDILNMKADMKALQDEGKIEEAYNMIADVENLKKERELALVQEEEEQEEIKNIKIEEKGEDVEMEKNVLNNEEVAFLNYVKSGRIENTSGVMKASENGVIIPEKIADQIIEKIAEISPVYARCTVFHLGGTLKFAVEGDGAVVNYVQEDQEGADSKLTFNSIELKYNIAQCRTLISKTLINNAAFDVLNYVVEAIAKGIAKFLEHEILVGTGSSAMQGAVNTTNAGNVTASGAKITIDNLIDVELAVPSALQSNCIWVMNRKTLGLVRKLEDKQGVKYLNKDLVNGYGYELLGHPVYVSDNMADPTSSNKCIVFGDFSKMYVKLSQEIDTQILKEAYATKHQICVLADFEIDSKISNNDAFATLTWGE